MNTEQLDIECDHFEFAGEILYLVKDHKMIALFRDWQRVYPIAHEKQ